jgi:hypothetical protein
MRPKKRILLFAEREEQASLLAFVVNNGTEYALTKAPNDRKFDELLAQGPWDLVIIPHSISPKRTVSKVEKAKSIARCSVLILTWAKGYEAPTYTGANLVLPYVASNAEILERMHILAARKRGPRKGTFCRKPAVAVGEVA